MIKNSEKCDIPPGFDPTTFNQNTFNIFTEPSAPPYDPSYQPSAPPYDPSYQPSAPPYDPYAPPFYYQYAPQYEPQYEQYGYQYYEPSSPPSAPPSAPPQLIEENETFSQTILNSGESSREKLTMSLKYILENSNMKDIVMSAYVPRLPNLPLSPISTSSMSYKLMILANEGYGYLDYVKLLKIQAEKIIGQSFNRRLLSEVECVIFKENPEQHAAMETFLIDSVYSNNIGKTTNSTQIITQEDTDYFNMFSGKTSGPRLPPGLQLEAPTRGISRDYIKEKIQEYGDCTVALVAVHNSREIVVSMVILKSDQDINIQNFEVIVTNPCYDPSLIGTPVSGTAGSILIPLLRDASILYDKVTSNMLSVFNSNLVTGPQDLTNFCQDAVNRYIDKYYINNTITSLNSINVRRQPRYKIDELVLEAINIKVSSTYYRYGFIPYGSSSEDIEHILMRLIITEEMIEKMAKSNSSYLLLFFLEQIISNIDRAINNNNPQMLETSLMESITLGNQLVNESLTYRSEIKTILKMPGNITTSEVFVRHGGRFHKKSKSNKKRKSKRKTKKRSKKRTQKRHK